MDINKYIHPHTPIYIYIIYICVVVFCTIYIYIVIYVNIAIHIYKYICTISFFIRSIHMDLMTCFKIN